MTKAEKVYSIKLTSFKEPFPQYIKSREIAILSQRSQAIYYISLLNTLHRYKMYKIKVFVFKKLNKTKIVKKEEHCIGQEQSSNCD